MEVVRTNFRAARRVVMDAAIKGADFVAIDTELTGLQAKQADRYLIADTLEERYAKLVSSATQFGVTQYGVATFKWQADKQRYLCHVFNVYLFPRDQDVKHLMQSSSIEFLAQHNFDFNKWVKEGVGYSDRRRVEWLKRKFPLPDVVAATTAESTVDASPAKQLIQLSGDDSTFAQEILASIDKWITSEGGPVTPLDLPQVNAFRRRIIYEQVGAKYGSELTLESVEHVGAQKSIRVSKLNVQDKEAHDLKKRQDVEDQLVDGIGFTAIIDMIIELKKPLVGHNMLLDLLHTFAKFVEPLPGTLGDFKKKVSDLFPSVFDTKYIFGASKLAGDGNFDSGLGDVFGLLNGEAYQAKPAIDVDESCPNYANGGGFHEAGYDAYCTGVAFARMLHLLSVRHEQPDLTGPSLIQSPFVQEYANLLFNMRCIYAHLNLSASDEKICKPNQVPLHVSGFPKDIKSSHIAGLTGVANVEYKWIDDTSFFIFVDQATDVNELLKTAVAQCASIQIVPAEQFFSQKGQPKPPTELAPFSPAKSGPPMVILASPPASTTLSDAMETSSLTTTAAGSGDGPAAKRARLSASGKTAE